MLRDLFSAVERQRAVCSSIELRVTYVEIYNEKIKDLLNPSDANLDVREVPSRGTYVAGPGDRGTAVLRAACSCEMKILSWCSRVLLPKPNWGDVRLLLIGCAPNVERVPNAWKLACDMTTTSAATLRNRFLCRPALNVTIKFGGFTHCFDSARFT